MLTILFNEGANLLSVLNTTQDSAAWVGEHFVESAWSNNYKIGVTSLIPKEIM